MQSAVQGLNDAAWHLIAVTRQGAALSLYVDGKPSGQAQGAGIANITGGNPFKVGRSLQYAQPFSAPFQAAGLKIWNAALGAGDIASLFALRKAPKPAPAPAAPATPATTLMMGVSTTRNLGLWSPQMQQWGFVGYGQGWGQQMVTIDPTGTPKMIGDYSRVWTWQGTNWVNPENLGGWSMAMIAYDAKGTLWCVGTVNNVGRWNGRGGTTRWQMGGWSECGLRPGHDDVVRRTQGKSGAGPAPSGTTTGCSAAGR